jgi:5-hydroxydodecatetraenal polyketide synthase CpkA
MRPNVALVASDAPNVAFGALDAPNATLGRMAPDRTATGSGDR